MQKIIGEKINYKLSDSYEAEEAVIVGYSFDFNYIYLLKDKIYIDEIKDTVSINEFIEEYQHLDDLYHSDNGLMRKQIIFNKDLIYKINKNKNTKFTRIQQINILNIELLIKNDIFLEFQNSNLNNIINYNKNLIENFKKDIILGQNIIEYNQKFKN